MILLSSAILADGTFDKVVTDCGEVVQAEVKDKGLGIRTVFKLAQSAKPGLVEKALTKLMPDFARELDPFYEQYQSSDAESFSQYVALNASSVADAMLNVTDEKVQDVESKAIRCGYEKLRGKAQGEVAAAAPAIAAVLEKYV